MSPSGKEGETYERGKYFESSDGRVAIQTALFLASNRSCLISKKKIPCCLIKWYAVSIPVVTSIGRGGLGDARKDLKEGADRR